MPDEKKDKGKRMGRGITKAVLVLGTAGIIGYSVIKSKILGKPPSKIRKGLLYATIAGVVLYKCQGEEIKESYSSFSEGVKGVYQNFHQKRERKDKLLEIMDENRFLERNMNYLDSINDVLEEENEQITIENKVLEKITLYKKEDSVKNNSIFFKDENKKNIFNFKEISIDESVKNKEKNSSQTTREEIEQFNNSKKEKEKGAYLDECVGEYSQGRELIRELDCVGNIFFREAYENTINKNIIWIIADGKSSINSISKKYYGKESLSEKIAEYNRFHCYGVDQILPKGMPLALMENGLQTKKNVFKGGFPRAIEVTNEKSLDSIIEESYIDEKNMLNYSNIIDAITKYNSLYDLNIKEIYEDAQEKNSDYYVLIPRFLKDNFLDIYSEFWVNENAKSGRF